MEVRESEVGGKDDDGYMYKSYVTFMKANDRAKRNFIMEQLAAQYIQIRPGTHAVHRLGYYVNKYRLKAEKLQNACRAEDTTITLPIFPDMTEQQKR